MQRTLWKTLPPPGTPQRCREARGRGGTGPRRVKAIVLKNHISSLGAWNPALILSNPNSACDGLRGRWAKCDWKELLDRARTGWLLRQGRGSQKGLARTVLLRPHPSPAEASFGAAGKGRRKRHRHRVKMRTQGHAEAAWKGPGSLLYRRGTGQSRCGAVRAERALERQQV